MMGGRGWGGVGGCGKKLWLALMVGKFSELLVEYVDGFGVRWKRYGDSFFIILWKR